MLNKHADPTKILLKENTGFFFFVALAISRLGNTDIILTKLITEVWKRNEMKEAQAVTQSD